MIAPANKAITVSTMMIISGVPNQLGMIFLLCDSTQFHGGFKIHFRLPFYTTLSECIEGHHWV